MNLGEKLAQLRKAKGLSQVELAEALGVSRQAVSRWEVGTSVPSIENIKCIRVLYGVSLDALLLDAQEGVHQKEEANPEQSAGKQEPGSKRLSFQRVALIVCILALLAAVIVLATRTSGTQASVISMGDMRREESFSTLPETFSINW